MKHVLVLLRALVLLSSAADARMSFGGGPHGGLSVASFPDGMNEFYSLGFGGGLSGNLKIIDEFAVRLTFDYTHFPLKKDAVRERVSFVDGAGNRLNYDLSGGNMSVLGIMANGIGKIPTGSVVTPYGLIGVGLQIGGQNDLSAQVLGQTVELASGGPTSTRFGMNFGAGAEFRLGRSNVFVEAKYVLIFFSGGTGGYIPFTVGVNF
jgi:opacity protein-like surface antigen